MLDIACLVYPMQRGWVRDRVAHEVVKQFAHGKVAYDPSDLLPADRLLVTHYGMLPRVLDAVDPARIPVTCLFTHATPRAAALSTFADAFNACHAVIAESLIGIRLLQTVGVRPQRIHCVPQPGDRGFLRRLERSGSGDVLVATTCRIRTNHRLLLDVARRSPRRFIVMGELWSTWRDRFPANVHYVTTTPIDPRQYYEDCDVFLSASTFEGGGPKSLIDAMQANLMPVAADTGNARDYIEHGHNGLIFPVDADAAHVADLLEQAYDLEPHLTSPYLDVSDSVSRFTWPNAAREIARLISGDGPAAARPARVH